jgi:hypothetical protein
MKTYKVWITVSDYAEQPIKYGEYWKQKEKPNSLEKVKKAKLIIEDK